MGVSLLLALGSPATWLIAMMFVALWQSRRPGHERSAGGRRPVRARGLATAAAGAAFQFLAVAYRPSLEFVAKAKIQQQEKADEDEPDTPLKHLHRQLRRIRRGEAVDQLVWRLQ